MRSKLRPVRRALRRGTQQLEELEKSLRQAAHAFSTATEFDYKLGLRTYGAFEVAFREGTVDEAVLDHSFDRDIFLPGMPEYVPDDDDLVIDVGAHIGTFTMLVSPQVRRVFAIEASQETYNYLRVNCLINGLDNVETFHIALGGSEGTASLFHAPENWGHSIMTGSAQHSESVPMTTLQTFMRDHEISHCDFLRFNCEGAEFPILLGTPPEVLSLVDAMLVLYHCDFAPRYSPEMLESHLASAGFDTEIRNRSTDRGWIVATRSAPMDSVR